MGGLQSRKVSFRFLKTRMTSYAETHIFLRINILLKVYKEIEYLIIMICLRRGNLLIIASLDNI